MKKKFKSVFDGIITTIIGLIVYAITILFLSTKQISFVWEGIAGLATGTILLCVPKAVEKIVITGVKSGLAKCGIGGPSTKPDNPDV